VLDLDIKAYFDTIPHELLLKALRAHADCRWVLLYVERWLKATNPSGCSFERYADGSAPRAQKAERLSSV